MQQPQDLEKLKKLAQTPSAQELIASLQRSGGAQLEDALVLASQGDFSKAQQLLSGLMSSPENQSLLKQLEGMK